ncbi:MAG: M15 family metallopeptidase [Ferruginibacter sp.]
MTRVLKDIIFAICLLSCSNAFAQDTLLNKYGLWVISSVDLYKKTIASNYEKTMVALSVEIPGVILDLKYARRDNFMHKKLYPPTTTTYLRLAAAEKLSAVQGELRQKHLGIKIWDAYRPYSVTEKMWETVKDDRYAADPKVGSGHNRGIAVDLTLVDLATNEELDMGTGFDNFSDTAHHDYKKLPEKILLNRLLLRYVMEKWGFKSLESEWWHYYLPDFNKYELLDISFEELYKIE